MSAETCVSRATRATTYCARLKIPSTSASAIRPFSRLMSSMAQRCASEIRVASARSRSSVSGRSMRREAGRVGLGAIERRAELPRIPARAPRQVREDLGGETVDLLGELGGARHALNLPVDRRGVRVGGEDLAPRRRIGQHPEGRGEGLRGGRIERLRRERGGREDEQGQRDEQGDGESFDHAVRKQQESDHGRRAGIIEKFRSWRRAAALR